MSSAGIVRFQAEVPPATGSKVSVSRAILASTRPRDDRAYRDGSAWDVGLQNRQRPVVISSGGKCCRQFIRRANKRVAALRPRGILPSEGVARLDDARQSKSETASSASATVCGARQAGVGKPKRSAHSSVRSLSMARSADSRSPPMIAAPARHSSCCHSSCTDASMQGRMTSAASRATAAATASMNPAGSTNNQAEQQLPPHNATAPSEYRRRLVRASHRGRARR
jgi:hypothetical protein